MSNDVQGRRLLSVFLVLTCGLSALLLSQQADAARRTKNVACVLTEWYKVWDDRGSGAKKDVSFWRAKYNRYYFLGDVVRRSHNGPSGEACAFTQTKGGNALKPAKSFKRIWKDKGSGAKKDAAFWRPSCPRGYVSLGDVVTRGHDSKHLKNIKKRFRCVRKDLVKSRPYKREDWNDRGSGADKDVSVWGFSGVPKSKSTRDQRYFRASTKHGRKPSSASYGLKDNSIRILMIPLSKTTMLKAIRANAPKLYFHPKEKYLISSVEHFLRYAKKLKGGAFKLRKRDKRSMSGQLRGAKAYVHVKIGPTKSDIQYWFFYPYNGPGTLYLKRLGLLGRYKSLGDKLLTPCGQHEGDWEHLTVTIYNNSGKVKSVYLSQHSSGKRYSGSKLKKIYHGGRMKVYASLNGHAIHASAERHYYKTVKAGVIEGRLVDNTEGAKKGKTFDSKTKFRIIAVSRMKKDANTRYGIKTPSWFKYKGRWGRVYTHKIPGGKFGKIAKPILKKIGVYDECNKESGPSPPWTKSNWLGRE